MPQTSAVLSLCSTLSEAVTVGSTIAGSATNNTLITELSSRHSKHGKPQALLMSHIPNKTGSNHFGGHHDSLGAISKRKTTQ